MSHLELCLYTGWVKPGFTALMTVDMVLPGAIPCGAVPRAIPSVHSSAQGGMTLKLRSVLLGPFSLVFEVD